MKIVINVNYGGFSLPIDFCEKYDIDEYDNIDRTDERLIKFVEPYENGVKVRFGRLFVEEIPDNATDYMIIDYDGAESVYYVLDGKIYEV